MAKRVSRAQLEAARQSLSRCASFPGSAPFVLLGARLELAEPAVEGDSLGDREFRGMCAVYGNEFLYFDRKSRTIRRAVCEPGMFADSVAEINGRTGIAHGNVPVLWEHWSLLGRTVELEELPTGLQVTGRITDEPDALKRYAHVVAGAARGMSVGFDILSKTVETDGDGDELDRITKGELWEATLCLWGANPLASVEVAASAAVPARTELALSQDSVTRLAAEIARLTTKSPGADEAASLAVAHLRAEHGARLEALEALIGRKE